MENFGFKKLTSDNWLKADPVMNHMVLFSKLPAEFDPRLASDWVKRILDIKIDERVPENIRGMYAVAKGMAVYGILFYPLFTMASQQLYRIVETAIIQRGKDLGMPDTLRKMNARLDWLQNHKYITDRGRAMLRLMCDIRNHVSHPQNQELHWPASAIGDLERIAGDVEGIFALRTPRWDLEGDAE